MPYIFHFMDRKIKKASFHANIAYYSKNNPGLFAVVVRGLPLCSLLSLGGSPVRTVCLISNTNQTKYSFQLVMATPFIALCLLHISGCVRRKSMSSLCTQSTVYNLLHFLSLTVHRHPHQKSQTKQCVCVH